MMFVPLALAAPILSFASSCRPHPRDDRDDRDGRPRCVGRGSPGHAVRRNLRASPPDRRADPRVCRRPVSLSRGGPERVRSEPGKRTHVEHGIPRRQRKDAQRRELLGPADARFGHDHRNIFVAIRGCANGLTARRVLEWLNPTTDIQAVEVSCFEDLAGATSRGMALIDDLLWPISPPKCSPNPPRDRRPRIGTVQMAARRKRSGATVV